MKWSWQQGDWPEFSYNDQAIAALEAEFLRQSGKLLGAYSHLNRNEQDTIRIEMMSDEALRTSAIEGEILDRASVQSSLRKNFGLTVEQPRAAGLRVKGIADLLSETYKTFSQPLDDGALCHWHQLLMRGQLGEDSLGCYRSGSEPVRIVAGDLFDPEVVFEAPPARSVAREMREFCEWYNRTAPTPKLVPVGALARSAIAHLYFETIHPFSDGNGRIGRAIAEKSLSQSVGNPILIALSGTIEAERKQYYAALGTTRFTNQVGEWVNYFARIVLASVENSIAQIDYLIQKTHFFDRYREVLNERQKKVLLRMFAAGPSGFEGGLSAANYIRITKTSPATARRDLVELVKLGALSRSGVKKGTRYALAIGKNRP